MIMITNADMTIYNYWYNSDTNENEYRATQIQSIHWHTDQKVAIMAGEKGVVSEDIYKIRIPDDAVVQDNREYIDAKQYHLLNAEEVNEYWTVDTEDLFVKGLIDFKATSLESLKQFPEAGKILNYSVNNFGMLPHIRIGGTA